MVAMGFSVEPFRYYNEHFRYLLVFGAMAVMILIGRKARSLWLQIAASFVLAVLILQSFLILRIKFDAVGLFEYGGLYSYLSLLGDALMLVLGVLGGTGLLLNTLRKGSD
ncbi:MAG TPA: hypothetical protein VMM38_00860 [Aridibacter sp.]|nr:hypothetical protein [Aridibacter sp.]